MDLECNKQGRSSEVGSAVIDRSGVRFHNTTQGYRRGEGIAQHLFPSLGWMLAELLPQFAGNREIYLFRKIDQKLASRGLAHHARIEAARHTNVEIYRCARNTSVVLALQKFNGRRNADARYSIFILKCYINRQIVSKYQGCVAQDPASFD